MDFLKDRNGNPVLPLGLQVNNSSTGIPEMLDREIRAVKLYGGNLLEAPVYWFMIEKERGHYDFSTVDDLIVRCREAGLYLIILWFGINKNGHPNYVPDWVKTEPETFVMAASRDGGHVATLSPLCKATMEADASCFAALMAHLKEKDGTERTVLAVQVENEIGYANTDMDYGRQAQEIYRLPVPDCLSGITLEDSGIVPSGNTWKSRFGRHAHEAFSAWAFASYVQYVANAGKQMYDLPLFLNVMLGEQGYEEAGVCYNSGAAVGRMLEIYQAAAPSIDFISPDMYVPDRERYRRVCARYAGSGYPLFIPESPAGGIANAMNIMDAFADFGCIGYACFGASGALDLQGNLLPDAKEMAMSMRAVAGVAPLLIRYRGTGRVHALVQQEFMDKQYLKLDNYHIEAKFINRIPGRTSSYINTHDPANADVLTARGRALLIQTGEHEFYLSGCGVRVDFRHRPDPMLEDSYPELQSRQNGTLNFLTVEEGHFEGDVWICDRFRNGDESNFELYVHRG